MVNSIKSMGLPTSGAIELSPDILQFVDVEKENEMVARIGLGTVLILLFGLAVVLLCVVGTVLEYTRAIQEPAVVGGLRGFLECFSVRTSARQLFFSRNKVDPNLEVLNGIRVLSMYWVILGHTFAFSIMTPTTNLQDVADGLKKLYLLTTINSATLSVDTFFTLSGFLSAMSLTKLFANPKRRSPRVVLLVIIQRYIRLLPMYIVTLLAVLYIMPKLFPDAPFNLFHDEFSKPCRDGWYLNLLYVNNFIKSSLQCIDWGWYLANDMQFFIVGIFIVLIYTWSKSKGLLAMVTIALLSIGVQIALISYYDLSTSINYPQKANQFDVYYTKPYCRINTYLLGMLAAWVYLSYAAPKDSPLKVHTFDRLTTTWQQHRTSRYLLYVVGFGLTYAAVYLNYPLNAYIEDVQTYHNVLYMILSRPIFIMGMLLIIYPVMIGCGKLLLHALGSPFFGILSKITYGAYLLHELVTNGEQIHAYHSTYFTCTRCFMNSFHCILLAYAISLVCSLLFESPVIKLEKAYLNLAPTSSSSASPKSPAY